MASFIRNALGGPSRLPQASYLLPFRKSIALTSPRYLSSTPRLLAPETESSPPPKPAPNPFSNFRFNIPSSKPTSADPDDWWKALSRPRQHGYVSTSHTSRSMAVRGPTKVNIAFRNLTRLIRDARMKIKVRSSEYHEGNSARQRRLKSQRHRRRFAAMVREKVKEVNLWQQRR